MPTQRVVCAGCVAEFQLAQANVARLFAPLDSEPLAGAQQPSLVDDGDLVTRGGHVHPHQLRHTLATQAINRGMSLETVAAMLGHKTLRMILVYGRVADRTVADAYDRATDQVDVLYTKPAGLTTNATSSASMARLAVEYDQRGPGNGWCNRPSQLGCQFESIRETCAYYATDASFNPTLQAQHDHAAQRGQHHRVDLFQMLLDRNQHAMT